MKDIKLFIFLLALTFITFFTFAEEKLPAKKGEVQILIVGLNDNIRSNYYYDASIAEETGINVDSVVRKFNTIIAKNIAEALPKSACKFITENSQSTSEKLADKIEFHGEGENCNSSLSKIPVDTYKEALNKENAKYLLVINQHYLKRQEQPMRTVFHIVSYTLYDQDQKEVLTGNQFFTSMKLESAEKIKQISRKSTAKIASSIARTLDL
ncbi:hypothetical protein [Pedobacter antarcticus]|uniref:Uncharacterized protein n=2 Tax=Pedobacter antarcticus TaxID=34086 RepID=A0A081PI60_9SPHI|nr:hypothetical protein [Pedobacter antarcticus]KEQ30383.1 hypothetical protein N180_16495 [Pedobacter antarcticus 4BY]SDL81154.1 hypothetical protein SAMN04488084_102535 [Pedobacter antarcticus]SFF01749.1 hypothetical protein SAMN03003324_02105 [Pedobacter antarcticus]